MSETTWVDLPHLAGNLPQLAEQRVQVWNADGSLLVRGRCIRWEPHFEDGLAVVQVYPEVTGELADVEREKAAAFRSSGIAPVYIVRPGATAQVAA